jgi:hypothetical protein
MIKVDNCSWCRCITRKDHHFAVTRVCTCKCHEESAFKFERGELH